MTRFEEIGVEIQNDAYSVRQANKSFERSCDMCCKRGLRIECSRCAIAATHKRVVESFAIKTEIPRVAVSMA